MDPAWVRSIQRQCEDQGVDFFIKQWGAHNAGGERVGKHRSGRELDGRTWDEFPVAAPVAA